jgi:hypothetical protein
MELKQMTYYMFIKINKSVGPPLSVWSRLLHVDGPHLPIALENLFDLVLRGQLCVNREGDEEGGTILISQIIPGQVAHYLLTFVKVRKLNLHLATVDFDALLVLLSLIIGSASTAN